MSCPACHNVHGSPSATMVRHGELISTPGTNDKVPSIDFQYTPVDTYPVLANSDGGKTRFIGGGPGSVSKNGICSMCHNDSKEYRRTPADLYPPQISEVFGMVDSDTLHVYFTEGVYTNSDASGNLLVQDFTLYDIDDNRNIVDVIHTAGEKSAVLVLNVPLDSKDDLGTDEISAATTMSIYDASGNAMNLDHTIIQENTPPDAPYNISPANGATGVTLIPTLQSSYFNDSNSQDTHQASRWQISQTAGDYTNPVYDHISTSDLTSHTLSSALSAFTTYYWHVQYRDNNGAWSAFSEETSFETGSSSDTVIIHPSGLASNPGGFSTEGGGWGDILDQNDGDASFALKCCGGPGDIFSVDMDDYPALNGSTIESFTINVYTRYSTHPDEGTDAGNMDIGYKTGSTTVWLGDTYVDTPGYLLITSQTFTTDSDGGTLDPDDITNMQIFIKRNVGGPTELRVTEIFIKVAYHQ